MTHAGARVGSRGLLHGQVRPIRGAKKHRSVAGPERSFRCDYPCEYPLRTATNLGVTLWSSGLAARERIGSDLR